MSTVPEFAPTVIRAIATLRSCVRACPAPQKGVLYHVLMGLAGEALCALLPTNDLGRLSEVSQPVMGGEQNSDRVADLWITPKEAATRLGHSERWLRRRRLKQPYCGFCVGMDSGRGYRVSLRGLESYMEAERVRAAHE